MSTLTKIWKRLQNVDGCWVWTGKSQPQGYGVSWDSEAKKGGQAHRIVYQYMVGGLEPREVLHHECRNSLCCNPQHLRVVHDQGEHISQVHNLAKTRKLPSHCANGHLYTPRTIQVYERADRPGKVYRRCLLCMKDK